MRTKRLVELQILKYLGETVEPKDYDSALVEGVAEVVRQQIAAGIDVIDDGEYGKLNWIAYLGQRLKGLVSRVRKNDPTYQLYSLSRVRDSTTRYVLVQRFESYETQLAHQTYPYILETMPPMQACMAGPPTVQFLDILD